MLTLDTEIGYDTKCRMTSYHGSQNLQSCRCQSLQDDAAASQASAGLGSDQMSAVNRQRPDLDLLPDLARNLAGGARQDLTVSFPGPARSASRTCESNFHQASGRPSGTSANIAGQPDEVSPDKRCPPARNRAPESVGESSVTARPHRPTGVRRRPCPPPATTRPSAPPPRGREPRPQPFAIDATWRSMPTVNVYAEGRSENPRIPGNIAAILIVQTQTLTFSEDLHANVQNANPSPDLTDEGDAVL